MHKAGRVHVLTIKIDDGQRPVVPETVDWHNDELLGKDIDLIKAGKYVCTGWAAGE